MADYPRLHEFNPNKINANDIVAIIGKRNSGKSTLLANLLFFQKDRWDIAVAYAGSSNSRMILSERLPPKFIRTQFKPEFLQTMIEVAKKIKESGKVRRLGLIMDDMGFDPKTMSSPMLKEIAMNGRHLEIGYWCVVQYLISMPCQLRSQVDYVFVLKDLRKKMLRKLWEEFFGVFETFDSFYSAMRHYTSHYGCLVLNGKSTTSKLTDSVFWYRPVFPPPSYNIGRNVFFKLNAKHTNKGKNRQDQIKDLYNFIQNKC